MNNLKTVLCFLLLGTSIISRAQTAEEIVNKHIAAIGGKEVITSIKSMITHADLNVMGSTLTSTTTVLVGKGFRNEANFNGQLIIQSVTPTSGWMINPLAGVNDPQPLPADQVKSAQSAFVLGGDLFNYKEKGSTIELTGKENIEGVEAIKVRLTTKDKISSLFFIDPATYYVIKRETTNSVNGMDVSSISTFSNFKKTETGFVMPYTTVTNQGFEMTLTINSVEFNKEIDEKIFEMPK